MSTPYTTILTDAHKEFLQTTFNKAAAFDAATIRVYASDASLLTGHVLAMVRPKNTKQIQQLLQWANTERIAIYPRGRGAGLAGACAPLVPGIVVSMLGLDSIIEISKHDCIAIVEAGVNTVEFQNACIEQGLFFPPDTASASATTLGGNVATCAGSVRALKYGVTRDYILGLEAVLPNGELIKLGGRAHKDVIGLDLTHFFIGSEGSLGIITKLIVKLLPKPKASASILAGYTSLDAAMQSMNAVFEAGILPCAMEFMNETTLDMLAQTGEIPWSDKVKALMLFQIDGDEETVPLINAHLAKQLRDAIWLREGQGEGEAALWALRRRIAVSAYAFGADYIMDRLSTISDSF